MKTLSGCLKAIVLFFFVCFVIGMVVVSVVRPRDNTDRPGVANEPPQVPQGWQYAQNVDDFDQSVIETLCVNSTPETQVDLRFPYQNATTAALCFRKSARQRGIEAFVRMNDNAQFTCSIPSCRWRSQVDGEVREFAFNDAAAGITHVVFFVDSNMLFRVLEPAERFRVEVEFYDHGRHTFEFPVAGLAWPEPTAPAGAEGSQAQP